MYTYRFPDTKFSLESHPFERICMYGSHEPSRFIGSYRDDSYIESLGIFLIYVFYKWSISSISGKIKRLSSNLHAKSSPESFITVSESTSREVLCWKICDFWLDPFLLILFFLPPIHFSDIFDSSSLEIFHISESRIDERIIFCCELSESHYIHMIIVIVWEEYYIYRWKICELHSWISEATRSSPRERTCAVPPYRVGHDVESRYLDEHSSMAYISDDSIIRHISFCRNYRDDLSFYPLILFSM